MIWKPNPVWTLAGATLISSPIYVQAKIYASTEQVQKIIFPGAVFKSRPLVIDADLQNKMRLASGVRHPFRGERIFQDSKGNWLIVDEVVGKHEMITYAVGLNHSGEIQGIEIMEYSESYGYEVSNADWRRQFIGKKESDPIKLNRDIQNISGATLSCKHITDGIKRVLVLHKLALENNSGKEK